MQAKIEAPKPRTFGALLFVCLGTWGKGRLFSSKKEIEMLQHQSIWHFFAGILGFSFLAKHSMIEGYFHVR
jgi:uncharacterized membrane protein YdcZ (DUF606 family)